MPEDDRSATLKKTNDVSSIVTGNLMINEPLIVTSNPRSQRDNQRFPMFPFEEPPTQTNSYGEVGQFYLFVGRLLNPQLRF